MRNETYYVWLQGQVECLENRIWYFDLKRDTDVTN